MRYLVDAMNVVGSRPDGWWRDRPAALRRLVRRLEAWSIAEDVEVTVALEHPLPIDSTVITVAYAPAAAANSADEQIIRLLRADEDPAGILVVTSDATLADRVRAAGAGTLSAGRFRDLLEDSGRR
ncbi:NYN domain-containing protein [Mycolicibacterium bacteremicum]|uniref:NYN domain-containing protein n=1 Tax=Mycolicibacterium bacteremicum TaxID=564198 RepID=UPI0026F137F5|nr:NYN domain-containing protein [Mycolicibacterium bacteremicum]